LTKIADRSAVFEVAGAVVDRLVKVELAQVRDLPQSARDADRADCRQA
jgi:hypothetical protein